MKVITTFSVSKRCNSRDYSSTESNQLLTKAKAECAKKIVWKAVDYLRLVHF